MTVQGVVYNRAAIPYVVPLFDNALNPPVMRLFVSDSTPTVGDVPAVDYTEAFGPNYAPQVVGPGFLNLLSPSPPLYGLLGVEFPNVGPLSPGSDTVFGWWIESNAAGPSAEPVCGGRFNPPLVFNAAGQNLFFDVVELPFHDCGVSIPLQSITLLDYFEETTAVPITSHAPLLGAPWTFAHGTWTVANRKCTCTVAGSGAFSTAITGSGTSNGWLRADVLAPGQSIGILFRGSDSINFWAGWLRQNAQTLNLIKVVAGAPTIKAVAGLTVNPSMSYRMEAIFNADTVTVLIDGGNALTSTGDTFNMGSTSIGLFSANGALVACNSIIFSPALPGV